MENPGMADLMARMFRMLDENVTLVLFESRKDGGAKMKISARDAVVIQKKAAAKRKAYLSDEDALLEYISTHWAQEAKE